MDMTRDKQCFIINKWQSTIETFVDIKTKDGYLIRVFFISFTNRRKTQLKATCYAQQSQKKQIMAKMREIMIAEGTKSTMKELLVTFIEGRIEKAIARQCNKVFPLKDVYVRKMKTIKKPKNMSNSMTELYSDKPVETVPKRNEEDEGNLLDAPEAE